MVRKDRAAIRKGDLSLIMDYSEKLNRLRRTKIQTEHWVNIAITIEVAVAEGFKATIPADDPVLARLSSMSPEERGKELDSLGVLEKQIYYHCSDYKEQEAKVTTHNMRVMLDELLQANVLLDGGTVWLKTDGCAKQYKCSKAMYLLCKLVADLRAEGKRVTIDQMLEVTGHGKDEADGHGGVFKNWLTGEMMRSDFMEGDESVVASSQAGRDELQAAREVEHRQAARAHRRGGGGGLEDQSHARPQQLPGGPRPAEGREIHHCGAAARVPLRRLPPGPGAADRDAL
mmetsp:Transcript_32866/g.103310  ORF Transcript_32866/g.103310 Transcript_32866/m.103310 type:complete len:287 (-) Transcript_32866:935-1795(-)